ncbi:MAG: LamG-like jellyroll fold domain-containing protein [Pseudomonadota bacterium]|nr:LamG-like jellyroll fold domain-containing protein [Pseudomonadota bacterium]
MKYRKGVSGNRGFALLLVFIIMSAVTIGLVMLTSNAFKGERSSKNVVTIDRMNTVAEALRKYYSGHHALPDQGPDYRIPVAELLLSTKYRFDGWGRFLHYNWSLKNVAGVDVLDLRGISVDGRLVAAVLVCGGPGQEIEDDGVEASWPTAPPRINYFDTSNDDIVVPVTLQSEAIEIAITTLHSLARKTCSYMCGHNSDILFDGEDLDGSGGVISEMISWFSLNSEFYSIDPWGNYYQWLDESSTPADSFRSLGPDGIESADDIVVVAHADLADCDCGTGPPPTLPTEKAQFTFESDQFQGNQTNNMKVRIEIEGTERDLHGHLWDGKGKAGPDCGPQIIDYNDKNGNVLLVGPPTATTKQARAIYFDGINDYLDLDDIFFKLSCGSDSENPGDFSLAGWFRTDRGARDLTDPPPPLDRAIGPDPDLDILPAPNPVPPIAMLISGRDEATGAYYFLGVEGDADTGVWTDYPFGGVLDGDGIVNVAGRGNNGIVIDEWHHLVVVFDNGIVGNNDAVLRLYKDGVLEREESGLPSIDCNVFDDRIHFCIGAGTCKNGNKYEACDFFRGWVDEVNFFADKNGNKYEACDFFRGWVDEVNFFAETLSAEQIIVLMDKEE